MQTMHALMTACRAVLRTQARLLNWNGPRKPWRDADVPLADMWRRFTPSAHVPLG